MKVRCPIRKLLQLSKKQSDGVYTRVVAVSLKRRDWKGFLRCNGQKVMRNYGRLKMATDSFMLFPLTRVFYRSSF